ncbi:uncharacterized protein LOC118477124 [Aplysia californica]|uniref:Uncharacterized protein LOC118477124 n=1 Tax=Aplysia californica TaxID=6500 RepID=A0ABM1W280_APLCA|nr:uncharacterized protein LOC118477124 [Aplysia californica]
MVPKLYVLVLVITIGGGLSQTADMDYATQHESSPHKETSLKENLIAEQADSDDPTDGNQSNNTALFEQILKSVPETCQNRFHLCGSLNPASKTLIEQGQFCTVLSNPLAKRCLVSMGPCTDEDFKSVKTQSCSEEHNSPSPTQQSQTPEQETQALAQQTQSPDQGNNTLINNLLSTRSQECQNTFRVCGSQQTAAKELREKGEYCKALSDPNAKFCLVDIGGCTEDDLAFAKKAVCTEHVSPSTTPQTQSPSQNNTALFEQILKSVPETCQNTFHSCGSLNPASKTLIEQGQFCTVLSNPLAKLCLVNMGPCSDEDFQSVKTQSCSKENVPSSSTQKPQAPTQQTQAPTQQTQAPTQKTQASTPQTQNPNEGIKLFDRILSPLPKACQDSFHTCGSLNPESTKLIEQGQYCTVLSNPLAKLCLVDVGSCTEKNFEYAKGEACKPRKPSLDQVFAKESQACQKTVHSCSSPQSPAKASLEQDNKCEGLKSPSAKKCLVDQGNCSQKDYQDVLNKMCTNTRTQKPAPTTYKPSRQERVMGHNPLTSAVHRLKGDCQKSFWECLKVLPTVRYLVNQKNFCRAMHQTSAMLCMVALGDCREMDIDQLRAATCKGVPIANINNDDNTAQTTRAAVGTMVLAILVQLF